MCGRYISALPPAETARWFRVPGTLPNIEPQWNAAPTQQLPVVRRDPDSGARVLSLLRWGLIPRWAEDPKIGYRTINARAETVRTAPAFQGAFDRRRCIVPAGGFYEWQKTADGKVPHVIMPAEGEIFGFAGLWENWKDPASGEWIRTYAIITGQPNQLVAPIHDRMPVILDPADYGLWLGKTEASGDELAVLLRPYPADRMRTWPVSARINSVHNEGADLIEPV